MWNLSLVNPHPSESLSLHLDTNSGLDPGDSIGGDCRSDRRMRALVDRSLKRLAPIYCSS